MLQKRETAVSQNSNIPRWLWGAGCSLGLAAVVVVCVLVVMHNRSSTDPAVQETSVSSAAAPSPLPPTVLAEAPSVPPPLDYPLGSVEEGCGLSEFPSYWEIGDFVNNKLSQALESEECNTALEEHINSSNPYLWKGFRTEYVAAFAFVVLEDPLTFERIFADPAGDLARVQDALSNPECLLEGDETNWELKETCHADAFMNYAMFNRYCYNSGRIRASTVDAEDPTPEQNVSRWKHDLEEAWIEKKCDTFAPELRLTAERYPELTEWLWSLTNPEERDMMEVLYGRKSMLSGNLIEHAARLGDNAAGLTQIVPRLHSEVGAVYGRFSWLLDSEDWYEFARKQEPSTEHFRHTFKMLALASARRPDPRDEIKFDWEWVARHLCEPPYYNEYEIYHHEVSGEIPEPKSCQEIVHELRQSELNIAPVHRALDKFEQVAIELGVYE